MLKLPPKSNLTDVRTNLDYPYDLGATIPLKDEYKYEDVIFVYGDSFAASGPYLPYQIQDSWLSFLSHSLCVNVRSFAVAGGSQQLTYKLFKETLHIPRIYTIIFHTNYWRSDRYSKNPLTNLTFKDYKNWDSLVDSEKTLHIYRDKDHNVYSFKNGKILFCEHWINKETNLDFQKSLYSKVTGTNHMTFYGNLLLAKDVVEMFKKT